MRRIPCTKFGPILCAALAAGGCETGDDTTLVARAGDYELSVDEAVDLLAAAPDLPADPDVVKAVGELWVDYVLLGEAARRDTTMEVVDVQPLVRQQVERRLILALRDSVIEADTAVTEAELRTLFEEERPGVSLEARHILLMVPEEAPSARQDSVRRLAERIREQAATGAASFEELAREHSQDAASARRGGELGVVERGQSVPAIEEVLFALEPGEVSEIVETPYGLHIFRLDERHEPAFEEVAPGFRSQVQERRHLQAESTYIAILLDDASLQTAADAAELTRLMAEEPRSRLTRRAARRPVVEYDGGELTLEEVLDFMQTNGPDYLTRVAQAPDEVVEDEVLLGIVQRELLLQRARSMGFSVPSEARDSLTRVARERFVEASGQLGVLRVTPSPGRSPREAVETRVGSILREMLSGDRDILPLGAVSYALRKQFESRVFESGVDRAVRRLEEVRGSTPDPDTSSGG